MADKWYYVDNNGDRQGPIELSEMQSLLAGGDLSDEGYVWKKGMSDWTKAKEIEELIVEDSDEAPSDDIPEVISDGFELEKLAGGENCIFLQIGADRGGAPVEYGPYSLDLIKKLFKENRINAKTYVFLRGMPDWMMLADFKDYAEIFEGVPPVIEEKERRAGKRKPFVARMFFESDKQVYVGICRDVSIGGMQILVDHIPAPIGNKISINVHPENTEHHFVADGEVVRHLDGGQGFSFRFLDLKSDAKEAIEKYLSHGHS